MTLSGDQARALKKIFSWYLSKDRSPYISLGGYAGTGKTTLIAIIKDNIAKAHKEKKLNIALCSYTGRAAQNLKNSLIEQNVLHWKDSISTIHGLIYDPIETTGGVIIGWAKKLEVKADLIIVDEASMVDSEIWSDLLSFNIPIIAVGDHGQLPPIQGNFNLMEKPHIRLEKIHRQAQDNPIIKISAAARKHGHVEPGKYDDNVVKYSQSDYDYQEASQGLLENYTSDTLVLCGYNSTRVKINQYVRSALGFNLPIPQTNDRVICLRNNHTAGIYNGMLGTLKDINYDQEGIYDVTIDMDDNEKPYKGKIYAPQFDSTEPINFTKERPKIGKADLFDFGYALTVHKAQGSQAKRVVLFEERFSKMTDDEWRRWLYTGITRAQEELYVFGK